LIVASTISRGVSKKVVKYWNFQRIGGGKLLSQFWKIQRGRGEVIISSMGGIDIFWKCTFN
jgi:hypothetical protein